MTLGTPIGLLVHNKDHRPNDYAETDFFPRPSHADYTYLAKYGVKASSGGGRASARETIGRVAAGAIAEKYLKQAFGVEIVAFVSGVGKVGLPFDDGEDIVGKELLKLVAGVSRAEVDKELTRCPHRETSAKMEEVSHHSLQDMNYIKGSKILILGNPKGQSSRRFSRRNSNLCHPKLSPWSRRTLFR